MLNIYILDPVITYSMIYIAPMVGAHIISFVLRIGIDCPLIYISAASGCGLFSYIIGKLSTIFGLSMAALLFFLREKIRQSKKSIKALAFIFSIIVLLILIFLSYIEVSGFYLRNLKNQTLEIITTCISAEEKARLNSFWSSMETRKDYKTFYFRIAKYAEKDNDVNVRYLRFTARHNFEIKIRGENK